MFSLICVWINGWVNNREAGDLRRYRGHYDVSVMIWNVILKRMLYIQTIWYENAMLLDVSDNGRKNMLARRGLN